MDLRLYSSFFSLPASTLHVNIHKHIQTLMKGLIRNQSYTNGTVTKSNLGLSVLPKETMTCGL